MSFYGRAGAVTSALLGCAGLYFESTSLVVVATLAAMASVVSWTRWTAPHDHWREFRRRGPGDP
jgi:hypothetical protein